MCMLMLVSGFRRGVSILNCVLAFAVLFSGLFLVQAEEEEAVPLPPGKRPRGDAMDHGPFFTAAVSDVQTHAAQTVWPADTGNTNFAYKGIAIKLNGGAEAAMCFDTDLMRMAFGWTGGYLIFDNTMAGNLRGVLNPAIRGKPKFTTQMAPGWGSRETLSKDPRPYPYGPLPRNVAHYKGLYLNGSNVILSYTVGDTSILEWPGTVGSGSALAFTRTIFVEKSGSPMSMMICDVKGGTSASAASGAGVLTAGLNAESATRVAILGAPPGSALSDSGGRIVLDLPALPAAATFKVLIWNGKETETEQFIATTKAAAGAMPDLPAMCKGGAPRWEKEVTTTPVPGNESDAYALDTLTLPDANPWNAWMRASGFDFLPDGRVALCTLDGDVWIVSGISPAQGKLTWKRFATGMFEPLGLRVVEGQIYVLGRDQITRLHDLNNDGEADFYENFNNDRICSPNYHAFAFDLVTDSVGNFYYGVGGHRAKEGLPQQGCVIRVSKDGGQLDVYARGLRSPNGFGMGPGDFLTYGDNQGEYIPSSKVTRVREGGFYGYLPHQPAKSKPAAFDQPLFWLPYGVDNSSGGQAWVPDERWGPYKGQMVHTSFGKAISFLCFLEEVEGTMQGGAVKIPAKFNSGSMRAKFNPADGQLYIVGTRGWQTAGAKDGAFQRLRYTGKPVYMPNALHVKPTGIEIVFPAALDKASATDEGNYVVEQWNIKYSGSYGSPEYSVVEPAKKGHDTVNVKSVNLSADGKTVFLEIPGLIPVMQMQINFNVRAADGTPVRQELYNTIHAVPKK